MITIAPGRGPVCSHERRSGCKIGAPGPGYPYPRRPGHSQQLKSPLRQPEPGSAVFNQPNAISGCTANMPLGGLSHLHRELPSVSESSLRPAFMRVLMLASAKSGDGVAISAAFPGPPNNTKYCPRATGVRRLETRSSRPVTRLSHPDMAGWWYCCQGPNDSHLNNPTLSSGRCTICGHTRCPSCRRARG